LAIPSALPLCSTGCFTTPIVVHIEGASYRLRQHADLIPENLRLGPLAGLTAPPRRRRGRLPKPPV
jgi:hypothetical protein